MAEIIIRKCTKRTVCSQEIYQEGIATGTPPFRPQHLSGWNGMKGIFRTAATSPLLITEWWDGLRYLLFPPACIPRCRRAEHLCQYSFSGKRRGQGFALRADKGLGKCGFLDATCWHLSGKPGQCCFTSQPGIQEVGCRENVGEMNGKWRDVLILKGVAGQWVAEKECLCSSEAFCPEGTLFR